MGCGIAQDFGRRTFKQCGKAFCQMQGTFGVKNNIGGVEWIAKYIGHIIDRITDQSLRINGQPFAPVAANDIIVVKISMQGAHGLLGGEKRSRLFCAPTDNICQT